MRSSEASVPCWPNAASAAASRRSMLRRASALGSRVRGAPAICPSLANSRLPQYHLEGASDYLPRCKGGGGVILLTGATGSIGVQLAPLLALRKEPFRVLARDAGKGRALGGEVVVGDLDDAQSVAEAMVGVDRVFLNAGGAVPAPGEQPMGAPAEGGDRRGARRRGLARGEGVGMGCPARRQAGRRRALGDRAVSEGLRAALDHAAAQWLHAELRDRGGRVQ